MQVVQQADARNSGTLSMVSVAEARRPLEAQGCKAVATVPVRRVLKEGFAWRARSRQAIHISDYLCQRQRGGHVAVHLELAGGECSRGIELA